MRNPTNTGHGGINPQFQDLGSSNRKSINLRLYLSTQSIWKQTDLYEAPSTKQKWNEIKMHTLLSEFGTAGETHCHPLLTVSLSLRRLGSLLWSLRFLSWKPNSREVGPSKSVRRGSCCGWKRILSGSILWGWIVRTTAPSFLVLTLWLPVWCLLSRDDVARQASLSSRLSILAFLALALWAKNKFPLALNHSVSVIHLRCPRIHRPSLSREWGHHFFSTRTTTCCRPGFQ